LHHGNATTALYRHEPGRAIVLRPGQDNAHYTRAIGNGCRTKQRINRRPHPILTRATREAQLALLDEQVVVWWSHIDMRLLKRFAVLRQGHGQGPGPVQDLSQVASRRRKDMQDNEDRRRELLWKLRHQLLQRLNTAY
jgi:hypothetical protein